jgi:hypothetical protein
VTATQIINYSKMLNSMNTYTGNQTEIQTENNYTMSYCNYQDEGWGQHIVIDYDQSGNSFVNKNKNRQCNVRPRSASSTSSTSSKNSVISTTASSTLKEYLNNLEEDYIPDIEPVVANFVPRIRNPNELEVIYHAKLPIIIKTALYVYKFACYCSGYN